MGEVRNLETKELLYFFGVGMKFYFFLTFYV